MKPEVKSKVTLHKPAEAYKARQKEQYALLEQGIKFDSNKPRMDLLDPYALEELAKVLSFGAVKYEPNNWRKGIAITRLTSSLLRHVFAFMRGESTDPETGLSHIAHAMCNCMFILWTVRNRPAFDDRPLCHAEPQPIATNCTKTD